ncbi:MAG: M48 family metallopeptidase [Ktedonobacterales bacterium]
MGRQKETPLLSQLSLFGSGRGDTTDTGSQSSQTTNRPHGVGTKRPGATAAPPKTRRGQVPEPQRRSIILGRHTIAYLLRVSARAQRLRLLVRPPSGADIDGLEVVVPRGVGIAHVEAVLREKESWIIRTLRRVAEETTRSAPPPLTDGRILTFAGREIRLAVTSGAPAGRFRAVLVGDVLALTVATCEQEVIRAALEAWYRRQAKVVFAERLAQCNATYGFAYGRVSIKEQKSRWGSCSRQGNLNFNWRLLLAPLAVLDYVVTHELAHLKEMNHSPRFWQLVARGCPDYLAHRRWLRQHGNELRF